MSAKVKNFRFSVPCPAKKISSPQLGVSGRWTRVIIIQVTGQEWFSSPNPNENHHRYHPHSQHTIRISHHHIPMTYSHHSSIIVNCHRSPVNHHRPTCLVHCSKYSVPCHIPLVISSTYVSIEIMMMYQCTFLCKCDIMISMNDSCESFIRLIHRDWPLAP